MDPDPRSPIPGFYRVASIDALPAEGGAAFSVGGKTIALFRLGDGVCAIDDACPHQYHPLSEGTVSDGVVRCSLHAWVFDVRTGGPPGGVGKFPRVTCHEVRLLDGWVYVRPAEAPPLPAPA